MKKLLRDLVKKLYFKICAKEIRIEEEMLARRHLAASAREQNISNREQDFDSNIVQFTLKQLGCFSEPLDLTKLSPEERLKICNAAKEAVDNIAVRYALDRTVENVMRTMLLVTNKENMIYDRFTVNGVWQVDTRLKGLAALADKPLAEITDEEKFSAV